MNNLLYQNYIRYLRRLNWSANHVRFVFISQYCSPCKKLMTRSPENTPQPKELTFHERMPYFRNSSFPCRPAQRPHTLLINEWLADVQNNWTWLISWWIYTVLFPQFILFLFKGIIRLQKILFIFILVFHRAIKNKHLLSSVIMDNPCCHSSVSLFCNHWFNQSDVNAKCVPHT